MRSVESPIFSPIKIGIFYGFRYGWRKTENKKAVFMKNGTTWYSNLCYYGNVKFKGAEPEGDRSFVLGGIYRKLKKWKVVLWRVKRRMERFRTT